jgi:selenophosphate synthase
MSLSGCDNKLRWHTLSSSLSALGKLDYSDSSEIKLSSGSVFLSIDTVFAFDCPPSVFGQLAVIHCQNDLISSGCESKGISVSVGVPRKGGRTIHQELMNGIINQASKDGIQLSKSHSYHSKQIEVTGAVVGQLPTNKHYVDHAALTLIATKPFGAKALFEKAQLSQDETVMRQALDQMLRSNGNLINTLGSCKWIATDVAGYGLAGCLSMFSKKYDLSIKLRLGELQYADSSLHAVRICKRFASNKSDFPLTALTEVSGLLENILYQSEFCGPILIFVEASDAVEIIQKLRNSDFDAYHCGSASSGRAEVVLT